jgi:hypothetical protein
MDMNEHRYIVGLDPGQANDPTAVVIIEHPSRDREPVYRVRALHRYPLGTSYPVIVDDISERLLTPPLARDSMLAIDATGVGAPVVDMFKNNPDLRDIYRITITSGYAVGGSGYDLTVPKRDLIMKAAILFQQRRVRIALSLPDTDALIGELLSYRIKTSDTGHQSFAPASSSDHDDLLLALSLALWTAEQRPASIPMRTYRTNARIPTGEDRFLGPFPF